MAANTGLASSNVSAGDDAEAAQYNNLVTDVKKLRQEGFDAGETIDGATLPVPVYQDTSDNEVYACDADDTDKLNFIGFAITNAVDAGAIVVQHTGIVGGFTGLDEGEKYYVQDAVGTIGKTPGTYAIQVGVAISSTELLIVRGDMEYMGTATDTHSRSDSTYSLSTSVTMPTGARFAICHIRSYSGTSGGAAGQDMYFEGLIQRVKKTSFAYTTIASNVYSNGQHSCSLSGNTITATGYVNANHSFNSSNLVLTVHFYK